MRLKSKKILGVSVTIDSKETTLEEIKKYLVRGVKKPLVIVTPNPEQVVLAQHDAAFANILHQADVAIPDGTGIAWAAGVKRMPGVEFAEDLVRLAAVRGVSIGLIGGRAGVAVTALECLRGKYPGLQGWAWEPGELSLSYLSSLSDLSTLSGKIKKTNTRMIFVGLGAPKQEFFIDALVRHPTSDIRHPLILMSVGGAFDILSGSIQRAPVLMRMIGLEWLWRLVRQPWRWRRQRALLKFALLVFREKIRTL